MIEYEVLSERDNLNLVAIIRAESYAEAKEKARKLGYDLEYYRLEESEDI